MTYNDRNDIFLTSEFIGKVRIALCDWLNYWAINGTSSIEDEELRTLTDNFVALGVFSLESVVGRVATLVISEASVKDAVEVTDGNVQTAVTHVLSKSLKYLM